MEHVRTYQTFQGKTERVEAVRPQLGGGVKGHVVVGRSKAREIRCHSLCVWRKTVVLFVRVTAGVETPGVFKEEVEILIKSFYGRVFVCVL